MIFCFRRFIILTNKNLFAFTSDHVDADCTMNLLLKNIESIKYGEEDKEKTTVFVNIILFLIIGG